MAEIGVFYRKEFDPGAYTVALYHAQITAAQSGSRLSLHTFEGGTLADASQQAPYIDGMLTFGPEPIDIEFLRVYERPSVVCERVAPGCAYVAPDNFDMGRTAANHLLMLKHKRLAVALPGDPTNLDSYHGSRFAGFIETAKDYGHPIKNKDQHFGAKEAATGITVAKTLLAQSDLPDAIYVQNLPMALAAFHTLVCAGVKIPNDISFLGTTFAQLNSPSATDHTTPPLTSVTFHKEEMGRQGVAYLISAAEGRAKYPIEILLPGVLVAGASTASSDLVISTN